LARKIEGGSLRREGAGEENRDLERLARPSLLDELLAQRRQLWAISDEVAALRSSQQPRPSPARTEAAGPPPIERPGLLVDDPFDTRWAHRTPAYHRVAHVFHQEWHGVRAAAGYSPGHKLAITSKRLLNPVELDEARRACEGWQTEQIVFHGFSETAEEFVRVLHKRLGGVELRAVYYGTTAQFHHHFELEMLGRLCNLRRKGLLSGLAGVKPGLHLLDETIEPLLLLSLPPRLERLPEQRKGLFGAALVPVPVDWRKNFYTSLFAAAGVQRLATVYVTSDIPSTEPFRLRARVTPFLAPTRSQLFRLMSTSDIVLNATLSECQPLTALEALALRVPCLTGPLGLGSLDEHPLQQLLQVRQVDSLEAVRTAIETMLDLREEDPVELRGMMADYQESLESQAFERWAQFLKS
jgi:hypothetical protein